MRQCRSQNAKLVQSSRACVCILRSVCRPNQPRNSHIILLGGHRTSHRLFRPEVDFVRYVGRPPWPGVSEFATKSLLTLQHRVSSCGVRASIAAVSDVEDSCSEMTVCSFISVVGPAAVYRERHVAAVRVKDDTIIVTRIYTGNRK